MNTQIMKITAGPQDASIPGARDAVMYPAPATAVAPATPVKVDLIASGVHVGSGGPEVADSSAFALGK